MSVLNACLIAFGTVIGLLSFMAVVMMSLTRLFPAPRKAPAAASAASVASRSDSGVESAITQAVNAAFPGARVSNIHELPR